MKISFISNFCDIFQEIQFLPLTAALRCSSLLSSVHILKHCLLPHFQYAAVPRRRSKMDERLNLRFETFDAIKNTAFFIPYIMSERFLMCSFISFTFRQEISVRIVLRNA